jgi:CRISPR system Cascade subunit CasE
MLEGPDAGDSYTSTDAGSVLSPDNETGDGRVLWRTDTVGEQTWLYVLSAIRPDFTHIVEQFGWPSAEQKWDTKDYTHFLSKLSSGQHWRFRLHANPVYAKDGNVYAHITVERQKQWLSTRAERNGFSLFQIVTEEDPTDAMQIIHRNTLKFRKRPSDKNYVTLSVATYEGELVVTNAESLRRALTCGIGRAKAYGCGLLTLARTK